MKKENYVDGATARILAALTDEQETGESCAAATIQKELVQSFRNGLRAADRRPKNEEVVIPF